MSNQFVYGYRAQVAGRQQNRSSVSHLISGTKTTAHLHATFSYCYHSSLRKIATAINWKGLHTKSNTDNSLWKRNQYLAIFVLHLKHFQNFPPPKHTKITSQSIKRMIQKLNMSCMQNQHASKLRSWTSTSASKIQRSESFHVIFFSPWKQWDHTLGRICSL